MEAKLILLAAAIAPIPIPRRTIMYWISQHTSSSSADVLTLNHLNNYFTNNLSPNTQIKQTSFVRAEKRNKSKKLCFYSAQKYYKTNTRTVPSSLTLSYILNFT